jgi:hypothetical protein
MLPMVAFKDSTIWPWASVSGLSSSRAVFSASTIFPWVVEIVALGVSARTQLQLSLSLSLSLSLISLPVSLTHLCHQLQEREALEVEEQLRVRIEEAGVQRTHPRLRRRRLARRHRLTHTHRGGVTSSERHPARC